MNNEVINWLLEEKEPSVRYRTLTELLGYSSDDKEVIAAKEKVKHCKNVERIFSRRNEEGLFLHKPEYYGNWTTFNYLTILAELGLSGDDERIIPIVDWILTPGEDKQEYFVQKEFGYAYLLDENNLGGCRQVSFLSTLIRLGYLDDPRVKRMIEVFVEKGRYDGGYLCKWKKSRHKGQEPKSCLAATVPALYLYSVLPESYRSSKAYDNLISYFTSRDIIFSKIEPGKIIIHTKIELFDGTMSHILAIMYSMCKLGLGNIPQMNSVWSILDSKPQIEGKYILESTNTKQAILMDKPGQPNKWVTLYMLLAKKGENIMIDNTSNKLANIRGICNGMEGKNYAFDDCMAFIMERLEENPQLDYWTFTWITGDGLTQVYNKNQSTLCEYCISGYISGKEHIENVFNTIGYDYTYVTTEQINAYKAKYINMAMEYIDKGIPVLVKTTLTEIPGEADVRTYTLILGYENNGDILLYINPYDSICKLDTVDIMNQDWIFIGDKKRNIEYDKLIYDAVKKMQYWLTMPEENRKCYGASAFRAWADDVENGRFDNEPDLWANYGVYFCNMATNSWANNIIDAPHASLLYKFIRKNPQYGDMCDKIADLYFKIGNGDGKGGIWKELEDIKGGFNVNRETFSDKEKKAQIAEKLREAADCMDTIVLILKHYI